MSEPERSIQKGPQRVGMREFRGNLPGYLRQVRQGSSFLVTSRGKVVAVVQPPQAVTLAPRQPGTMRGKIQMAPDFDVMPDDLLSMMEAGTV